MKTKTIELSDYIAPDLYFWAKEHNRVYGESLPVRVRTDITRPIYWDNDSKCFDFCIELIKMPFIARAKLDIYVDMYEGSVAKRISGTKKGTWMRLYLDKNNKGNNCGTWIKSCNNDDWYFADDSAWVKATFNEDLLNESI